MAERPIAPGTPGPHRRLMPGPLVLIVLAAVLAAAVVTARDTLRTEDVRDDARRNAPATPDGPTGGGDGDGRPGTPTSGPSAAGGDPARLPSRRATPDPGELRERRKKSTKPTPSATPAIVRGHTTPAPTPTRRPDRSSGGEPVEYERLRVGDCFDMDRDNPGTPTRRRCDRPHDAEVVARLRLAGALRTDDEVRRRAAELCRAPLRAKAAAQPSGTYWTTYVQYPYRSGYLLGYDTIVCSLAVLSDSGRKLEAPLQ
ncbi:hypothetical protein ACGFMM_15850 [Streptomyces sp. NPDC048604]|uniref:hypothetical protein n=1 Tax=Streptomyces sp. NPDC048604 TaxID=3365578 RepID=UPI0037207476